MELTRARKGALLGVFGLSLLCVAAIGIQDQFAFAADAPRWSENVGGAQVFPACGSSCSPDYGAYCYSGTNSCGQSSQGTIDCSGACNAVTPGNPAGLGSACSSAPNACGQTNSGTIQCNGACSAATPANSSCSPSTPTLYGLYQGPTYRGTTVPAYDPSGYELYAYSSDASGGSLAYYFEWYQENPAGAWQTGFTPAGWGGINHYLDYNPGLYYARAWAYNSFGNWSAAPTAWLPITLTTPALTFTCSGEPSNPYVGQTVTWSSSVTSGSGTYSYSWSGSDGLSGTGPSVQKAYTTSGPKVANLTVTDTRTGQSGTVACTNGAAQSNGPSNGGPNGAGGGSGPNIGVGTCTASLSSSPAVVEQGQNTSLAWSVTGGSLCASSCVGSGFSTGGAISGSVSASAVPAPPTTAYAITCSGGTYGPPPPANATVTVLVPVVDIKANNQDASARVNPATANNTTISWTSEHTASCSVTKNGSAWQSGLNSSGVVQSVTVQTIYAIDCQNNYGAHATDSVTVNVIPSFEEF